MFQLLNVHVCIYLLKILYLANKMQLLEIQVSLHVSSDVVPVWRWIIHFTNNKQLYWTINKVENDFFKYLAFTIQTYEKRSQIRHVFLNGGVPIPCLVAIQYTTCTVLYIYAPVSYGCLPACHKVGQRPNSWMYLVSGFFSLMFTVTCTNGFYPLPHLNKSCLKLVCNVNIVYRNLKSEDSQDYAQKPKRNCTFMNSAIGSSLCPATGRR